MTIKIGHHPDFIGNRRGFTLIEIAIVMVIIGILTGGGISLMKILTERKARNLTIDYLHDTRSALISFTANQGRLPWADSDGDGLENGAGAGNATLGTLPYLTLRMAPVDAYKRVPAYEVNTNLVTNRTATCAAIRAGLAGPPEIVDADGAVTAFPVAAVLISPGPMDADTNGNVFDDIATGSFLGNNASGTPNYLRHPPLENTFDDLTAYIGANELFAQICEYLDLAVNNTSASQVVVWDLNNANSLGTVAAIDTGTFSILSGTRLEMRDTAGIPIASTPTTPMALAGQGQTITVP